MAKKPVKKSASKAKPKKAVAKKPAAPKVHWLAEGYQPIVPFLTVKDVGSALKFYNKAFGFATKFAMEGPDKKIIHAEMLHEGLTIMMGGENAEQHMHNAAHYGASALMLYVYSSDVNALCKKAKKAGATCLQEPQDMYWGDRICMLADPDGYNWMFATHVKDVAPEDMHP